MSLQSSRNNTSDVAREIYCSNNVNLQCCTQQCKLTIWTVQSSKGHYFGTRHDTYNIDRASSCCDVTHIHSNIGQLQQQSIYVQCIMISTDTRRKVKSMILAVLALRCLNCRSKQLIVTEYLHCYGFDAALQCFIVAAVNNRNPWTPNLYCCVANLLTNNEIVHC
jgi:hypothetical protein